MISASRKTPSPFAVSGTSTPSPHKVAWTRHGISSMNFWHAATPWAYWRKTWTSAPANYGGTIPRPIAWLASSTPPCVSASVGRKHYEATRRGFEPGTCGQIRHRCAWPGSRSDVCTASLRRDLVRMERAYGRKQPADSNHPQRRHHLCHPWTDQPPIRPILQGLLQCRPLAPVSQPPELRAL